MLESAIEKKLKIEVQKRGGEAYKFTSPGLRGMPDRIVLLPGGRTIFVELKAQGKKLRPLQVKRAAELRGKGFEVYAIDSHEGITHFINEVFGDEV